MTLWQSRTKRMDGSAIETSEGAVQVGQPALKNANAALSFSVSIHRVCPHKAEHLSTLLDKDEKL